jgi:uncharacterized protein YfaS (alpha-2-macroglobulin family)
MLKLLSILTVLAAGALICLSISSQPATGTVQGICRDAKTGQPIDQATVDVDLNQPDDTDTNYDDEDQNSRLPDLFAGVPDGWTQGSQDDDDLDFSGHEASNKTHWETETDSRGHFILRNVTTGNYTITASSSAHASGNIPVAVSEGNSEPVTVTMTESKPSLTFDTPGKYWATDQSPSIGLNGVLPNPIIILKLERLNIDQALAIAPKLFLVDSETVDSSGVPGIVIRQWTDTIEDSDDEGSFYDQIHCAGSKGTRLPVGLYRLTATSVDDKTVTSVVTFVVTDLSVVGKAYGNSLLLHAANIRTGKSVGEIYCSCMNSDSAKPARLSSGMTASDGTCTLSTIGATEETMGMGLVRRGDAVAALEIDLNSPGSVDNSSGDDQSVKPASRQLRAFIYTDRPVYRPGNTVHIKGISRWFQQNTGFAEPKSTKVEVAITDAQGTTVFRKSVATNSFGSWITDFTLSTEALTGAYTVQETLDDQSQTGDFAVAAYHKPEYQVDVTFDKNRYIRGDTVTATVAASYYFGAPMSGATASVDIYRSEGESDDEDTGDSGDDNNVSGEWLGTQSVTLDGNGQAKIMIKTADQDQSAQQMYYSVNASVDNNTGQTVTAKSSAEVAQGDFSIDTETSSTVANVGDSVNVTATATDSNSHLLVSKSLEIKTSYDVWQDGNDVHVSIGSGSITTGADGAAQYNLQIKRAGLIDIDVSGVDDRGNKVTSEAEVWVADPKYDIPTQYSDLSIILNKKIYKPGDTARVLITTSHPGPDALVTVEGSTLYKVLIIPLVRRATEVDIPVTEEDAPGVTIAADCVVDKQYLSSTQDLTIDDPQRALNISVQPDHTKYHPGDQAAIDVHTMDETGKPVPADVSVAIVDSAIFAIMPDSSGKIGDAFLPAQSDQVVTSDSAETVYYGDVDKGATNIDIRHRFPDTALWAPDISTDSHGDAKISLTMPDTLTTWRITAYGQTHSTMVGKAVGQMVVNKDLAIQLETPPFLVQGDRSTMTAMVHNNTSQMLNVHLKLTPDGLTTTGELEQDFQAPPNSPVRLAWAVQAKSVGTYQPTVTVQAGTLTDGVVGTVLCDVHGSHEFMWTSGSLKENVTKSVNIDSHFLKYDSSLTIRLSPTLASALPPAAEYLADYPYDSSDSTASCLLADSVLYQARTTLHLDPTVVSDLQQKTQRSLLRTYHLQQDDGGWGWFSTDTSSLDMTAYATYAMSVAKSAGVPINPTIFDQALTTTASLANTERSKKKPKYVDQNAIVLAALDLAENESKTAAKSNLAYFVRQWTAYPENVGNTDLATAAIAEQAIGTPASLEEAQAMMSKLWSVGRETGVMMSWTYEYHSSSQMAADFLPDVQATAWALLAAERIDPGDPRIDEAARWLMSSRLDDYWCDTDTTAVTITALTHYLAVTNELSPSFNAVVSLNGKSVETAHFSPDSVGNPDLIVKVPGSQLAPGPNLISLSKDGTGRLYYSVTLDQALAVASPSPPPSFLAAAFDRLLHPTKTLPQTASGYRVKRIYMRLTSRRNFLWEDSVPTRDWDFNDGDSILVRLIIDSVRPGAKIVIDEPVPAGCRIAETSGEYDENWDNWWDYTDVRDSDIVFFVDNLTAGRHEIDYHLIANRPGVYDIMPTNITSMVDPTLQAVGSASKVRVDGN